MSKNAITTKLSHDEIQWQFVYPDPDSNRWQIKLTQFPYKGLTIEFRNARVEQLQGETRSRLFFDYTIVDSGELTLVKKDEQHLDYILGNILAQIVLEFSKTMTMVDDERKNNTSNSK
jgi:hypothetical protein